MKKVIVIACVIACTRFVSAQTWGGSGSQSGDAYRTGQVGIGMTSPDNQLDIETTTGGDGMEIKQSGNGAAGIKLNASSGHEWYFFSTGSSDGWGGANDFAIQDATSEPSYPRMFIDGANGYTGFGTISPSAKLHALNVSSSTLTTTGINGVANGSSYGGEKIGGNFESYGSYSSTNYGIKSYAHDGEENIGGYFLSDGEDLVNHGIEAYSTNGTEGIAGYFNSNNTNTNSYGIEAVGDDYAGYFIGNVSRTGSDNFTSDRKLKDNIVPLENSLAKIMELKPSSYTFKTNEFPDMNLPKGNQLGLIAQDLEKVFPELVVEMKRSVYKDGSGKKHEIPDYKTVQYISLIPVLISAMQEQRKLIAKQDENIQELKEIVREELYSKKQLLNTEVNISKDGYRLQQNIPNPFTKETEVKYTMPLDQEGTLILSDLSGKQLKKYQLQKNTSSVIITSERLQPGIYIYSLISDNVVCDSKRLVISE